MAQIIAICNEHKIPLLASFSLDAKEGLLCTTQLLHKEWETPEELYRAGEIILGNKNPLLLTIRDSSGKVAERVAIL